MSKPGGGPTKPTVCGVRVATWDTEQGKKTALKHTFDQELFGGNTGHAAISLTIPVTDENTALIKKYCSNPSIPVEKLLVSTPKAKLDETGKWVADHSVEAAHKEEVYSITFSWWPGSGGFFLSPSINSDGYDERTGVHREWNPKFREFFDVEQRIHTGKLERTKMTYGATNIIHTRNLEENSEQRKYLNLSAQLKILENSLDSLEMGISKLEEQKGPRLSETTQIILDRFIPDWRKETEFDKTKNLTSEQVDKLKTKLEEIKTDKEAEQEQIESDREALDYVNAPPDIRDICRRHSNLEDEIDALKTDIKSLNTKMYEPGANKNELTVQVQSKVTLLGQLTAQRKQIENDDKYKHYVELKDLKQEHSDIEYACKLLKEGILENANNNESFELDDDALKYLDEAFEPVKSIKNWREHFFGTPISDPLEANVDKIKEIYNKLSEEAVSRYNTIIDQLPAKDCFQAQDYESFLSMGLPPENEFKLSINDASLNNGAQSGMDPKAMLEEMHNILTEGVPFDLNVNNCSVTVSKILEAGAQGEHLKSQFQNRALGTIATPQLIVNNTKNYISEARDSPKDNMLKRIQRWNPIEQAIGNQIHRAIAPDSTGPQKTTAWLAAGSIALASSPLILMKGLIAPQKTIKKCKELIEFANNKNHTGFKTFAYTVGGLGMGLFAAPALVEAAAKAPVNGVNWLIDKQESKKIRKDKEHADISQQEMTERETKQSKFKSELGDVQKNIVTIKNKDANTALEMAQTEMAKGNLVSFDTKTRLNIENHIQNTKDSSERAILQKKYSNIVNETARQILSIGKSAPIAPKAVEPAPRELTRAPSMKRVLSKKPSLKQTPTSLIEEKVQREVNPQKPQKPLMPALKIPIANNLSVPKLPLTEVELKSEVLEQKQSTLKKAPSLVKPMGLRKATSVKTPGMLKQTDLVEHSNNREVTLISPRAYQQFRKMQMELKHQKLQERTSDQTIESNKAHATGFYTKAPDGTTLQHPIFIGNNGEMIALVSSAQLGKGGYGTVFVGMDLDSGKFVAVKSQTIDIKRNPIESIQSEQSTMNELNRLVANVQHEDKVYTVDELGWGASYSKEKKGKEEKDESEGKAFNNEEQVEYKLDMSIQFLEKIAELHDKGFVNRDIKSENLLWDAKERKVHLVDFGLAKKMDELKDEKSRGTAFYMAPEVSKGEYSAKSDIFACGVVMMELFSNKNIFSSANRMPWEVFFETNNKNGLEKLYHEMAKDFFENPELEKIATLVKNMVSTQPDQRPDMKVIIEALKEYKNKINYDICLEKIKGSESVKIEAQDMQNDLIKDYVYFHLQTDKSFINKIDQSSMYTILSRVAQDGRADLINLVGNKYDLFNSKNNAYNQLIVKQLLDNIANAKPNANESMSAYLQMAKSLESPEQKAAVLNLVKNQLGTYKTLEGDVPGSKRQMQQDNIQNFANNAKLTEFESHVSQSQTAEHQTKPSAFIFSKQTSSVELKKIQGQEENLEQHQSNTVSTPRSTR